MKRRELIEVCTKAAAEAVGAAALQAARSWDLRHLAEMSDWLRGVTHGLLRGLPAGEVYNPALFPLPSSNPLRLRYFALFAAIVQTTAETVGSSLPLQGEYCRYQHDIHDGSPEPPCLDEAEWEIWPVPASKTFVYACTAHVGRMLGNGTEYRIHPVAPMAQEEKAA